MREMIALWVSCLLVALACFAVVLWTLLRGDLWSLDGLLLASICLLLAGVFGFLFAWVAYDLRLWEMLKRRPATANPVEADQPK